MPSIPSTPDVNQKLHEEWRKRLNKVIDDTEKRVISTERRWNFWFYFLFISATSIIVLFLLALVHGSLIVDTLRNDVLAISVAVLFLFVCNLFVVFFRNYLLSMFVGQNRLKVSRTALSELRQMKVDVQNPNANVDKVTEELKFTLTKYENGVFIDYIIDNNLNKTPRTK